MTKLTPELREAVIAEYKTGELLWKIAAKHKIDEHTVRRIAFDAELPPRGRGCKPGIKHVVVYGSP